jgi:sulfur-carrier protein
MIRILFFAQLRERLECDSMTFDLNSTVTVGWLRAQLIEQGEIWRECFQKGNLLMAVNQTLVDENATIHDGDEVAFFPPVTGG